MHFYPRSPCGERHKTKQTQNPPRRFLSTLSLRRATSSIKEVSKYVVISIHALLAESDAQTAKNTSIAGHFYPRSPCGERLVGAISQLQCIHDFYPRSPCGERPIVNNIVFVPGQFLSTLSLRRATSAHPETRQHDAISIHALLAESDLTSVVSSAGTMDFYPRSPCGERLKLFPERFCDPLISIHALLAESDNRFGRPIDVQLVFLSTLSLRRAT